jgi:hypothetical protein
VTWYQDLDDEWTPLADTSDPLLCSDGKRPALPVFIAAEVMEIFGASFWTGLIALWLCAQF